MGNVVSVSCDPILSRCLDCTIRGAKHVQDLEDNLEILHTQSKKLFEARNDVMRKVEIAERQQMKRMDRVQGWLKQVQDVEAEVDELLKVKSQQIEKLCLGGYCSKNCKSSYKFGKAVAKILKGVDTLWGERTFEEVAERVPEDVAEEIPIEPTTVGLQSSFDKVWSFLGNEQVGIIGIYGPGGVGKTTLLKQIYNSFCNETHNFDAVIWVVVSKEPNFEKIQEDIGRKIGLLDESWKNRSLQDKARDIFNVLNKKRFLLCLDDIWKRIDLTNQVGVPQPSSRVASKIMFTTRFLEVCGSMKAHNSFKVECLRYEEAWKLFQETLQSDVLESHSDIPELAKIVAEECGGLPLALITVSRAMACKKTAEEWRYAIQVLKNSAYKFAGMGTEVYPLLKFSFDNLPSDIIRSCLLYCSMFPEDYTIRKTELIDCWIGEDLLDEYNGSKVYDQGYDIIGVLVRACLLEEENQGGFDVKMHDVIRDMVLWIACEIENQKEKFLVQAGMGLTEPPEIEKCKGVKRMSLMENKIKSLSKTPVCPDLQTLFVNNNRDLTRISGDFFEFMYSLKVLNLSFNQSLTQLPYGILKLVSLQYIDLSGIRIKELSIELQSLRNLKCLSLEYTFQLHTIPRELISNFVKLNVLRMFSCGDDVFHEAKEDSVIFGGGELLVEELLGLKCLNVLTITLRSASALQRFLSSVKLQSCTQCLGLQSLDAAKLLNVLALATLNYLDVLFIEHCEDLEELKIENVDKAPQPYGFHNLTCVEISSCPKLRELTWLIFVPNLKFLYINDCEEMEEIISHRKLGVSSGDDEKSKPFLKLQTFGLVDLQSLKSIYWKALPFPHLKEIYVNNCSNLKKLPLDSNSAKNEHKIVIEGTEEWWKEVQWADEAAQDAFFPCFKSLNRGRFHIKLPDFIYENAKKIEGCGTKHSLVLH